MEKKVFVLLGIGVVLILGFFYFSQGNKSEVKKSLWEPKKVIVYNHSNSNEHKEKIKLNKEVEPLITVIEDVIKNKKNLTEITLNIDKGDFINVSRYTNKGIGINALDSNIYFTDIYGNIIFNRSYNGPIYIGNFYESDENITQVFISTNKTLLVETMKAFEEEEEKEKNKICNNNVCF